MNSTKITSSGGALAQAIEPTSVQESLLDRRSLLEKRLKSQLESPSDLVDRDLVKLLIKHLLADFAKNDSGLSDNTIKTLFIYWQSFELWCHKHQFISLPASVSTFIEYMNDRKSSVKMNTLSQYRWAVSKIHLAAGLPSPCHTQKSIDVVGGIRKQKIRSSELVTQASPFRSSHCDALIDLWARSGTPLQYRNLAIMVMAYETMMRESELARIELSHLSYQLDGRATLLIPFSKTNMSGDPDTVMLSRQCVSIVENYLSQNVNKSNFLFKKMKRNGKPAQQNGPISRYTIDRVFKRAFDDLYSKNINLINGLVPWSGHSARVGACQDLLSAGYSILEVQQAGRWASSEMVYRYGRNILAKESAMAKARWER